MSVEGRLAITLSRASDGGVKAEIASSRPLQVASFFAGKTPEELLSLLPSLFSVCGMAQSCAAVSACEQALGIEATPEAKAARQLAVWAETAREHILRIALDWGEPKHSPKIKSVMPLAQNVKSGIGDAFTFGGKGEIDRQAVEAQIALLEDYLEKVVFDMAADAWLLNKEDEGLGNWAAKTKTQAAALIHKIIEDGWQSVGSEAQTAALPTLPSDLLFSRLTDQEFIARPLWAESAKETSTLTRNLRNKLVQSLTAKFGTGLLTRLTALLVELAGIPQRMRHLLVSAGEPQSVPLGVGAGLAQIEAARGRLVHGVRLEQGKIADFRILAPTEWNFHPRGCAARGMETFKADDDQTLLAQAKLLICAIDPCVAFDVRIA